MKELKEIPKTNPFKVPEDYFGSLDERILSATSGIVPLEKGRSRVFRLRTVIAIAASVTILATLGIIASMLERNRNNAFQADISIASETYLYDIDILTIEESVAQKDILTEKTGVNKKDIIDYLVLENIDESDIYEKIE